MASRAPTMIRIAWAIKTYEPSDGGLLASPSRAPRPVLADIVAKVENRTTLKISRKLIFRPLCCCVAFRRHYGGPWSILDQPTWSLTSPSAKRISGSKNFRSTRQKDFCNNIRPTRTFPWSSAYVGCLRVSGLVMLAARFSESDPDVWSGRALQVVSPSWR
jgi:hypothetical protein